MSFIAYGFSVISWKPLPNPRSQWFTPMLSPYKNVLLLIFRSLVNFELIFTYDVKLGSNFLLLYVEIQMSLHAVEETSLSPIELSWHPYWNQLTIKVWVYFWIFNYIPLTGTSIFVPVSHCSFVVGFETRKCEFSNLFFFRLFWLFGILSNFV